MLAKAWLVAANLGTMQSECDVMSSPEIVFVDVGEIREYGTSLKIGDMMSSPEIVFADVGEIKEYGVVQDISFDSSPEIVFADVGEIKEYGIQQEDTLNFNCEGHFTDIGRTSDSEVEEPRGKRRHKKRENRQKNEEQKLKDKLYQRKKRQNIAQKRTNEKKLKSLEEKVRFLESKFEAHVELRKDEKRVEKNKRKREVRVFDKVSKQRDEELLQKTKLSEILKGDGCVLLGSRNDQLQFLQEKLDYDGIFLNDQDLACKAAAVRIIFKNAPNKNKNKFIVHYNNTIFRYL